MSLVSNLTNTISNIQPLKISAGLDINDKTFADILEKQMNESSESSANTFQLGIPAGFEIQNFSSNDSPNSVIDVARKQAMDMYSKYSKSVVTDIEEFVSDTFKILK